MTRNKSGAEDKACIFEHPGAPHDDTYVAVHGSPMLLMGTGEKKTSSVELGPLNWQKACPRTVRSMIQIIARDLRVLLGRARRFVSARALQGRAGSRDGRERRPCAETAIRHCRFLQNCGFVTCVTSPLRADRGDVRVIGSHCFRMAMAMSAVVLQKASPGELKGTP
jgi:hypothetical protein